MNYSTDSRKKIEKKSKSKAKQVKKKGKVTALRIIVMAIIIGMFAVVGAGLGVFIGIIKSAPAINVDDLKPQGQYTSFVYDDEGNEIATFAPTDNRIYAPLSEIPLDLQHAIIATEDERFYVHNGIDIKGIFRALVKNIQEGNFSEGASTITQQLVKNNLLTTDKKITRKIQEQYLAVQYEKICSKDVILEYYLNTIGLSQGVSGVQAAAQRYFGKDVSELSLSECVVIAVITQWPTRYDPINHPENNREKAIKVLQKMEEQGYITAAEHAAALEEDPYANIRTNDEVFKEKSKRSYFVDALFNQLVSDLQELGYTEAQAKKKIYGDGLEIHSTYNEDMQKIAEKYLDDPSQYPDNLYKIQVDYSVAGTKVDGTHFEHSAPQVVLNNEDEIEDYKAQMNAEWGITPADTITASNVLLQPQPQTAFVLMDYRTGQIKALYGGRGDKINLGFNFATQAERQPGSTFKVLASYAPAIDTGLMTPSTLLKNEAVSYTQWDGKLYSPKNWDNNYDGKDYTVRQGIANSMNILAVKTLDLVGLDTSYNYLERFGFTTLVNSDKNLPLALGGITNGVTPLELNAAYGAIANDGMYVKPIYYTTVTEKETGKVLIDNTGENVMSRSHQVIQASTARMLTDMMTEVIDGPNKHTGGTVRKYFPTRMPISGKTGTTTASKDLLFAGYTPYYVATIWTGYAKPEPISSANGGSTYHLKLWGEIMNEIHENLEYKSFPEVASSETGVKEVRICTKSGKIATSLCEQDPDHCVKSDYFTDGNAPTEYCDIHEEVRICVESGKIATDGCPETKTEIRVRNIVDGIVQPDEICDIHVTFGESPLPLPGDEIEGESNGNPFGNSDNMTGIPNSPTPEVPPVQTVPEPSPQPSLPPIVDPNASPNIDDESVFAIPQY